MLKPLVLFTWYTVCAAQPDVDQILHAVLYAGVLKDTRVDWGQAHHMNAISYTNHMTVRPDTNSEWNKNYTVGVCSFLCLILNQYWIITQCGPVLNHHTMWFITIQPMDYAYASCFVVIRYWPILPIFFGIPSLALGQSYDCPSACEGIVTNIGKLIKWITTIL